MALRGDRAFHDAIHTERQNRGRLTHQPVRFSATCCNKAARIEYIMALLLLVELIALLA